MLGHVMPVLVAFVANQATPLVDTAQLGVDNIWQVVGRLEEDLVGDFEKYGVALDEKEGKTPTAGRRTY